MLRPLSQLVAETNPAIRKLCPHSAHRECCDQPHALVIDVREAQEAAQNPIAGSINIPRGILEVALPQQINDPQHPIYLHCASGMRAMLAADQLLKLGYQRVSVIDAPLAAIREAREQ